MVSDPVVSHVAPEPASLASPCVDICAMDTDTDWCIGCGRTIGEISNWSAKPTDERRAILAALPARMVILGGG